MVCPGTFIYFFIKAGNKLLEAANSRDLDYEIHWAVQIIGGKSWT